MSGVEALAFHRRCLNCKEQERGPDGFCAACSKVKTEKRALRQQQKTRKKIVRRYGLSLDEYDAMLTCQQGRCAICHAQPSDIHLAVDHDHSSGRVRGLLCSDCNLGIGLFRDQASLLVAAAEYLTRQSLD